MSADLTTASDRAQVGVLMAAHDPLKWTVRTRVDKFDDEQVGWARGKLDLRRDPTGDELSSLMLPYDCARSEGNLLTTAGLNRLTSLLIGAGGQAMTATATRIGVGNSSVAAAVGQTDLQAAAGAANRWFQIMDATYPTQANGVVTLKSSYASGDANHIWNEWGIDVAVPVVANSAVVGALLFNRKVDALGTKSSGVWALTTTITIS